MYYSWSTGNQAIEDFMDKAHRRHDISEHVWDQLEPHLPGRKGLGGGRAKDNRQFINAVFWILRTGAPWRDLPPDYGGWSNTHRRFIRWRDKVYGPNKRGLNSKVHSAVDAVGNPIRILITSGTTTDCSETRNLIDGLEAGHLLANR